MRSSLAPLDGTLSLQGLSAPVTVTRDTFGIPHIQANNKMDALRALGFVQASERLFQLEVSRRLTQGELSEVFGDAALNMDKLYRSLMLKRSVERMLAKEKAEGTFNQKTWDEMAAYFDGVNQYQTHHPLPYEMQILGIKARPFSPLDAYIMTGHMAYGFAIAMRADPLMTELAKKLPAEQFQALRNFPLKAPLKIVENSAFKDVATLFDTFAFPFFEGSNAWLISAKRSQSGKSLFANDPHIGFSAPAVWFEAHIKTPEFELYGHYLPLIPFAVLGHNHHHAWGFTMSLNDDMDLYREKLDRENKTVLYKNKPVPYQEWQEVIKVKNQDDVVLNMIETPHGPLLNQVLADQDLALAWAFHRRENNPMRALMEMAEAKSMQTFESAMQYATAPGLNVMYADSENIAWWTFGDMAIKKNPNSDMVLEGSSGEDEYVRLLTWQEKPHLVNPEAGFIVTANSRPLGLPDTLRGDWQSDDRFQTITTLLEQKDTWNSEELKSLQTENLNLKNRELLTALLENLQLDAKDEKIYSQQLKTLKNWDLRSEVSSVEAALYHQWNNENVRLMLEIFDKETQDAYLNTPYAWVFYERTLLDPQSAWWENLDRSTLISKGFKRAADKLKHSPAWGELHTIEYKHPLGRSFPLSKIFNLGPYPMPGAFNEINNNKMKALGDNFQVVAGPSTRRIIDFANPQRSWGINPIGNSGHMLSPFYKDQVQLFLDGKYRPQLMDDNDIHAAATHQLILQ
ncbi:MAG: penicillin acylase family protein [Bdellovibrio sp.]|nr:penicillin acylase family protein [Bdellovibrio sp.]